MKKARFQNTDHSEQVSCERKHFPFRHVLNKEKEQNLKYFLLSICARSKHVGEWKTATWMFKLTIKLPEVTDDDVIHVTITLQSTGNAAIALNSEAKLQCLVFIRVLHLRSLRINKCCSKIHQKLCFGGSSMTSSMSRDVYTSSKRKRDSSLKNTIQFSHPITLFFKHNTDITWNIYYFILNLNYIFYNTYLGCTFPLNWPSTETLQNTIGFVILHIKTKVKCVKSKKY